MARPVAIAEGDESLALQPRDPFVVVLVIALAMGDGDLDDLALGVMAREGRVVPLDAQMLHLADEAQIGVAHQDARQQPALA